MRCTVAWRVSALICAGFRRAARRAAVGASSRPEADADAGPAAPQAPLDSLVVA